jgi:hypothetical protein
MVFPCVKFLLPILWGIITLLPVVLAESRPVTVCHSKRFPIGHRFKQDCRFLATFVTSGSGPRSELSTWTEKRPTDESQDCLWSTKHGHCIFTFMTNTPLSTEIWDTVVDDLKAIQQYCVDHEGNGGNRYRKLNHTQLESLYLWVSIIRVNL